MEMEMESIIKSQSQSKHRTRVCNNYPRGSCKFGDKCNFLHTHDIRDSPPPLISEEGNTSIIKPHKLHPKYRTQLCQNYLKGLCRFGNKCNFLHTLDIRGNPPLVSEEETLENTIVLLVADLKNGNPVFGQRNGEIEGIDIPQSLLYEHESVENYVKVLNYIIRKGYKIFSTVGTEKSVIVYLEKQNIPVPHRNIQISNRNNDDNDDNDQFPPLPKMDNTERKHNTPPSNHADEEDDDDENDENW